MLDESHRGVTLKAACSLCSHELHMLTSGFILDHHDPSLFPERWVDLAVVLTCDNSVLYERLKAR